MQYLVRTRYKSCTVSVTVHAIRSCTIWLEAHDADQENTYLIRRHRLFAAGETQTLLIQMPQCGNTTVVSVFENSQKEANSNFEVKSVKVYSLPNQMNVVNMRNSQIRNFVPFAQRFCYTAGVIPTYDDRLYVSDNGGFEIKYSPIITDDSGKEQLTPARINKFTKVIEVSKAKFLNMTVPMRFCILCHEFSHLFVNEDMYDELEADLNGLTIYLGLGYPRIEAHETFLSVFYQAPSDDNMKRYEHISNFINKFEELNFEHL